MVSGTGLSGSEDGIQEMTTEQFMDKNFRSESMKLISICNRVITEYADQGFTLTLRQLYYQLVARAIIPNKQSEYNRLGILVSNARLAGLIDWSAIEDRTRNIRQISMWDNPQEIMKIASDQYKENPWDNQKYAPEVWIEKDALVGIIEPICTEMRVPYFSCRGYTSQSEAYKAGKRLGRKFMDDKKPIVLHLGDHDPSGLDMSRDIQDRLSLFSWNSMIEVRRLALNIDQIRQYNPPPNPAKDTDSRFLDYVGRYGHECWELDALEPTVIHNLIEETLSELIDWDLWDKCMKKEKENRKYLRQITNQWERIISDLED